ncbi:MAG: hypothetical protein JO162_04985, partial [Alphaproteobacteria bacterium]|nr:hypothetical protein [Alphaproteobacteria bacterium]
MNDEPTRAPVDGLTPLRAIRRRLVAACCAMLFALPGIAAAESSPHRGGVLPFAVDA